MKTKAIRFLIGEFQNVMHTSSGSCDFRLLWCRGLVIALKGRFGEDWNRLATISMTNVQPTCTLNVWLHRITSLLREREEKGMVELSHEGEPQTYLLDISIKPQTFCYTYMQHFFPLSENLQSLKKYEIQLLSIN